MSDHDGVEQVITMAWRAQFGDSIYENTAVTLVRQYAAAPALVVDVRGNGGGATPQRLLGALMNRPWRGWQEVVVPPPTLGPNRTGANSAAVPVRAGPTHTPAPEAYPGRVFVLIDRFCGSACEDFVMPFKDTGRGVVVGETTQGSSGNPYRADVGHGISVAVGATRYRFPSGAAFEGVGIEPDVAVERRIAELSQGRDAPLDRVQQLASAPR